MLVNSYAGYGGLTYSEGEAHSWCDANYPIAKYGTETNDGCKKGACLFGHCSGPPPWTEVGKTIRGLPGAVISLPGATPSAPPQVQPSGPPSVQPSGRIRIDPTSLRIGLRVPERYVPSILPVTKKMPTWAWAAIGAGVLGVGYIAMKGKR